MRLAVTEFPPIALYVVLSLAVAVLSLVAAFHREAVTANKLFEIWGRLLNASAYLSISAWFHLALYSFLQFLYPTSSLWVKLNQLGHLLILSSFGGAFYYIWRFWTENRIGPQRIMHREGD